MTAASIGLAQQGAGGALAWAGVMVVALVGGGIALVWLRRRLLAGGGDDDEGLGLTLDDLRAMRRRGDVNDEEFGRLRRLVLGSSADDAATGRPTTNPLTGGARARPGFDLSGEALPPGAGGREPD